MPRAQIRLQTFRLDGRITKTMDEALKRLVRTAAREWLRATVVTVPVWSGEARGSIKYARGPYGTLSRYLNVSIPIVPIHARPNKNQMTGSGKYNFVSFNKQYGFYFRSDVTHYIKNEFFPRTDAGAANQQITAPWQSLEAGQRAFNRSMKEEFRKLPKIQSFMIKHTIPFGV